MLLKDTQTTEETLATLPKLTVLNGLQGQDELGKTYTLPKGHKLAAYEYDNGHLDVIPQLRSENYFELDHRYTLQTLSESLTKSGLDHQVWKPRLYKQSGIMQVNLILDMDIKVEENAFELDMGLWYGNGRLRKSAAGLYHPMITITNSFFSSSVIEFGVVRIICENGLIDRMFSQTLKFRHLVSICQEFETRCEALIENVLVNQTIEQLISTLAGTTIEAPTFLALMSDAAGKRITEAADAKFSITKTGMVTLWVAFNIATYCATHLVKGQNAKTKLGAMMLDYQRTLDK